MSNHDSSSILRQRLRPLLQAFRDGLAKSIKCPLSDRIYQLPPESDARCAASYLEQLGLQLDGIQLAKDWQFLQDWNCGPKFDEAAAQIVAENPEKAEAWRAAFGMIPTMEELDASELDRRTIELRAETCASVLSARLGELLTLLETGGDDLKPLGKSAARKQPTDHAIAAYRLSILFPGNQKELAEEFTRQTGRLVDQGTISRWLSAVKKWLQAGNVLPDMSSGRFTKPVAMDPDFIDLGENTEGRPKSQRRRKLSDSAD